MRDKDIDRCLRYLDRIDIHSSGVQGEIMFIKEVFEEQRTSPARRKQMSKTMKETWKKNPHMLDEWRKEQKERTKL